MTRLRGLTRRGLARTGPPRVAVARRRPVAPGRSVPCPLPMGRADQPSSLSKSPRKLEARWIRTRLHPGSGGASVSPGRFAGSSIARAARSLAGSSRTPTAPSRSPRQRSIATPASRARTPHWLAARRPPHATRRSSPGPPRRDAEQRSPAPADDQVPPPRPPTPRLDHQRPEFDRACGARRTWRPRPNLLA